MTTNNYRANILVCGGTGCTASGAHELVDNLQAEINRQGLAREIRDLPARQGCAIQGEAAEVAAEQDHPAPGEATGHGLEQVERYPRVRRIVAALLFVLFLLAAVHVVQLVLMLDANAEGFFPGGPVPEPQSR